MFDPNKLDSVVFAGKECLPIVEGGKGVQVSTGHTSGAFAHENAIGTFSGVNAAKLNNNGEFEPLIYKGSTRKERHEELMIYSIEGAISQAKIAHEKSSGNGRVHMNILWEMAGAERIIKAVLEKASTLIHGITCGAGMPYNLSALTSQFNVHYYPIISSMRAFRILWVRSYKNFPDTLGGVVYEDPWKAGGHNGLSSVEKHDHPEPAIHRVKALRKFMNEVGLNHVPIIMAGGVWNLSEYEDWLQNKEIGPIAFQFGTRPIMTTESPVPLEWKKKLLTLDEGDVFLNKFSPTGFYSSAVDNNFIDELRTRSKRQVPFSRTQTEEYSTEIKLGARQRKFYILPEDKTKIEDWHNSNFTENIITPDSTMVFVTKSEHDTIIKDQVDCMGCLKTCKFSNWSTELEHNSTGNKPDPRSFCIQKTLQDIVHDGDVDNQLMFAGHNAFRFKQDAFYKNNFIPTTKQLIEHILTGQ